MSIHRPTHKISSVRFTGLMGTYTVFLYKMSPKVSVGSNEVLVLSP